MLVFTSFPMLGPAAPGDSSPLSGSCAPSPLQGSRRTRDLAEPRTRTLDHRAAAPPAAAAAAGAGGAACPPAASRGMSPARSLMPPPRARTRPSPHRHQPTDSRPLCGQQPGESDTDGFSRFQRSTGLLGTSSHALFNKCSSNLVNFQKIFNSSEYLMS